MQGFSSSLKNRFKNKWAKSLTGHGPRRVAAKKKARVYEEPKKKSGNTKKRKRGSVAKKY